MNHSFKSFLRQFFCLSVISFAVITISAQSSSTAAAKPQPILFGSWTEPGKPQLKVAAKRPQAILFDRITAAENPAAERNPSVLAHRVERARVVRSPEAYLSAASFNIQPTALEQEAFNLVNEQRRRQNLPPLKLDLGMLYIARQHSADMSKLNFFSHAGLDGLTADGRARASGINDWRQIGENIAYNQGVKNQAEVAIQSWMGSEGHRRNILGQSWSRAGIGVAVSPDGGAYFTQVFRD